MPLPNDQIDDLAREWALGDEDAVRFLVNFMHMVRLADDIADGDSAAPVPDMANLLVRAWLEHSCNPFFQRHSGALGATMANAVLMWEKSEDWRQSDNRKTRMFAFVARETVEHVAHTVAFIVGGYQHAKEVAQEIHELSHQASGETFEDWEVE
ncbi:hypothetical protein [Roseovarius nitratireducens]|uniref:hypothetical protein n=1 Tax=Roseovarius nitratireducens TaxID=2044597 RepID=UPI000CE28AA4|nr:hypothetical protein [Roseovarius nitratireducens]